MKKIFAIILAMLIMFTMSVYAEETTAGSTLIFMEDDFNEATLGVNYKSDLIYPTGNYIAVADGVGYNGTRGLKIDNNSGGKKDAMLYTNPISLTETDTVFLEYKLKIENITPDIGSNHIFITPCSSTNSRAVFTINKDSNNEWYFGSGSFGRPHYYFTYNTWYTVVLAAKKGATSQGYLFDESGKVCSSFTSTNAPNTDNPYFEPLACFKNEITAYVDDMKAYRVATEPLKLIKEAGSVSGGEAGISRDSAVLSFNQPVSEVADGKIKLFKGNEEVEAVITKPHANELKISKAGGFEPLTEYTVKIDSSLSAISGGVYQGAESISFTTARGLSYSEDNFDDVAAGTVGTSFTSGNVLIKGNNEMTVEAGAGYNGTNGYRINTSGTKSSHVQARTLSWDELGDNETIFYEYKMKINSAIRTRTAGNLVYMSTTTASITNGWSPIAINEPKTESADTHISISNSDLGSRVDLPLGQWYTVVLKVKKNAATVGYVYDHRGILIKERAAANVWASGNLSIYLFTVPEQKIDAVLDDFKMYILSTEKMEIKESSVVNGAQEVPVNADLKITFNQPLSSDASKSTGAISLYEGGTKINATVKRIGADTLLINPENMLKGKTEYTLKMESGLDSLMTTGYSGIGEIRFTTESAYPVELKETNLTITNGAVSSGDKTIKLYNAQNAFTNAKIVVALYNNEMPRKLIGCEVFTRDIEAGENNITVTLGKNYSGVASAEILLYDSLATMKSIMFGYRI